MNKFLLKEQKVYQVDSEEDGKKLIEEFSAGQFTNGYKLVKSACDYKNKKVKGEIVEEWYLVTVTLSYEVE